MLSVCSNNTNKLSPQEPSTIKAGFISRSNNTNKLSPQEHYNKQFHLYLVQIIQINLVLKNALIFEKIEH